MTQLVKLRAEMRASCLERGIKLSYMPLIVKVPTIIQLFSICISLLFAGLLTCPPALPHLEQHIRHRGRNDHLQGVSQHSPCHGHPNGPTGAKHQGGAEPLCLWDCVRAQQAAATWCRWKTINIRSHWGHFFSEVSRTSLTSKVSRSIISFLLYNSNIGSIGGTYAKPVILPPQVKQNWSATKMIIGINITFQVAIGALGKMMTVPR